MPKLAEPLCLNLSLQVKCFVRASRVGIASFAVFSSLHAGAQASWVDAGRYLGSCAEKVFGHSSEVESPGLCIHATYDSPSLPLSAWSTTAESDGVPTYSREWKFCRDDEATFCQPCPELGLPGEDMLCRLLFVPRDCRWTLPAERVVWLSRNLLSPQTPLVIQQGAVGHHYSHRNHAEFVEATVSGVLLNNQVWIKLEDVEEHFVPENSRPNLGEESTQTHCQPGRGATSQDF